MITSAAVVLPFTAPANCWLGPIACCAPAVLAVSTRPARAAARDTNALAGDIVPLLPRRLRRLRHRAWQLSARASTWRSAGEDGDNGRPMELKREVLTSD